MRQIEKAVMLQTLDTQWKDHLAAMDYLRQGIHLRGYAQKNPKQEYKREAFEMFSAMLDSIKQEVVDTLLRARRSRPRRSCATWRPPRRRAPDFEFKHEEFQASASAEQARPSGPCPGRAGASPTTLRARGAQGRAQRALPLRLGQEVQAVPRQGRLRRAPWTQRTFAFTPVCRRSAGRDRRRHPLSGPPRTWS